MTQTLTVVHNAEGAVLGLPQPARLPVGEVVAQQATSQHQDATEVGASVGVWESSPGVFRRHLKNREFSHIVSGWCVFTPDGGDPVVLARAMPCCFRQIAKVCGTSARPCARPMSCSEDTLSCSEMEAA